MINCSLQNFVHTIHLGEDAAFIYKGVKYFSQGWFENGKYTLTLDIIDPPGTDYLWLKSGTDRDLIANELFETPLFNGKSFWEIEKDVEWVD